MAQAQAQALPNHQVASFLYDALFILLVTGFMVWIANMLAGNNHFAPAAIGVLILAAITFFAMILAQLPVLRKLPMVFWVSSVAVVVSLPVSPISADVLAYTKEVGFLPITTPILAYAGLSLGKDVDGFKRLSWRIVPVALAVAAGSFICSTALAEVMLHLEGIF